MSGNVTNSVAITIPGKAYTTLNPIPSKTADDAVGSEQQYNHQTANDRRYRIGQIDNAVQNALDLSAQPIRPYQVQRHHDAKQRIEERNEYHYKPRHHQGMQGFRPEQTFGKPAQPFIKRTDRNSGQGMISRIINTAYVSPIHRRLKLVSPLLYGIDHPEDDEREGKEQNRYRSCSSRIIALDLTKNKTEAISVLPGMLPATKTTAPNSANALENASIPPLIIPGSIDGRMTLKKVLVLEAPIV